MRVDETRMKQVRRKDIMERIIAAVEEEKAKMEERKAAARTEIVDSSICAEDLPAPDAKDRP
jgi:hypothetical protein